MWTIVTDQFEFKKALKQVKGSYQEDLLYGYENLSGSTLRGTAKNWGGKYKRSRENLLARLTANGVVWSEFTGKYNRRILVIGDRNENF